MNAKASTSPYFVHYVHESMGDMSFLDSGKRFSSLVAFPMDLPPIGKTFSLYSCFLGSHYNQFLPWVSPHMPISRWYAI